MAVEGDAARMVADIAPLGLHPHAVPPRPYTPDELLALYESRFLPAAAGRLAITQFYQATQGANETAVQWGSRLREMFMRARPNADFDHNPELVHRYIHGMYSPSLRAKVFDGDPQTLNAAIQRATEKEANMLILRACKSAGSHIGSMGGRPEADSDGEEEGTLGAARNRGPGCLECGSSQHFKRDCPKLKANCRKKTRGSSSNSSNNSSNNRKKRTGPGAGRSSGKKSSTHALAAALQAVLQGPQDQDRGGNGKEDSPAAEN